jgi:hypothetical protein
VDIDEVVAMSELSALLIHFASTEIQPALLMG